MAAFGLWNGDAFARTLSGSFGWTFGLPKTAPDVVQHRDVYWALELYAKGLIVRPFHSRVDGAN